MDLTVFSGTANRPLGDALAQALGRHLGKCHLERFPDGELHVELQEDVRGRSVCLIQPTVPPVGENLLELLLMADACWRGGATRLMAVLPYFGYARQDRRSNVGEALGGKLVADLLERGHFERLVAVNLHTPSLEGCFAMPLEHLNAGTLLAEAARPYAGPGAVVVSPDLGAVKLAERYARQLGLPLAIVHKSRTSGSEVNVRGLVGEVRGLRPIIVDDLISTAGTIAATVEAVREAGCANEVTVVATHALLVGPAVERLSKAPIHRLISTDSVLHRTDLPFQHEVVSLAPLLADAIRRVTGTGR
ncbi:ribose-phosphate pyrophosphokinase [Vitiosangium sp. GDMCC 1.1324]|uniref:ribose-phosphate diphosphokinase n=1 Tax=Vitiosangium sp. (strain GDMCC 1.1324) TaxID=2138576 RepID=UPI000D3B6FFB|nr:ribose-phosphate pyrophosphokinase [Vitiosangium sp. GDMCC 1.1324]PTL83372.1 ribose-phosphate pyrophosphokinase [Vitiosangium sp. GDMCC 1.1324]